MSSLTRSNRLISDRATSVSIVSRRNRFLGFDPVRGGLPPRSSRFERIRTGMPRLGDRQKRLTDPAAERSLERSSRCQAD